MDRLASLQRRFQLAWLTNDWLKMVDYYSRFRQAFIETRRQRFITAQDEVGEHTQKRRNRRSLSPEEQKKLRKEKKELSRVQGGIKQTTRELYHTIVQYCKTIAEFHEKAKDLAAKASSDEFAQLLNNFFRDRGARSSGAPIEENLSKEAITTYRAAQEKLPATLAAIHDTLLSLAKQLTVLQRPIKKAPGFLLRWFNVGQKNFQERIETRKRLSDGRIYENLSAIERREAREYAATLVEQKLKESSATRDLNNAQRKRITQLIVTDTEEGRSSDEIAAHLDRVDLGLENIQEQYIKEDLLRTAPDLLLEGVDRVASIATQCKMLFKIAQSRELQLHETAVDDLIAEWDRTNELFVEAVTSASERLVELYGDNDRFAKQRELVESIFVKGRVVQDLVLKGFEEVQHFLDAADEVVDPQQSAEERELDIDKINAADEVTEDTENAEEVADRSQEEGPIDISSLTEDIEIFARTVVDGLESELAFDKFLDDMEQRVTANTPALGTSSQQFANTLVMMFADALKETLPPIIDTVRKEITDNAQHYVGVVQRQAERAAPNLEPDQESQLIQRLSKVAHHALQGSVGGLLEQELKLLKDTFPRAWEQEWDTTWNSSQLLQDIAKQHGGKALRAAMRKQMLGAYDKLSQQLIEKYKQLILQAFNGSRLLNAYSTVRNVLAMRRKRRQKVLQQISRGRLV